MYCRPSVEGCIALCNGQTCTSEKECPMGAVVCELGHCQPCDATNDMKGLRCSNGLICEARHCSGG